MPIYWTDPCPACGKQIALDNRGNGITWAIDPKNGDKGTACCSPECAHRVAAAITCRADAHVCPCCKAVFYEATE